MLDISPLITAMGRAGFRSTAPRRAVAGLIAARTGPFTATDLVDDADRQGLAVGRATVFRTLEALAAAGAVERVDLPSGDHAYLACQPAHHHHVVCTACGRSIGVEDAGLRSVVRELSRRTGYEIDQHRLELFGRCPDCLASDAGRRATEAAR